ncbi:hypothetical protein BDZ45DRAFT_739970 [Acephala macrosclerotiorum]|nr:hypothetical protein BDZ45DRAFT_739970 [Acephala macrosclerotiorum]
MDVGSTCSSSVLYFVNITLAFVLGDFLFIRGGVFSQLANGVYEAGNGPSNSRHNNVTFSIGPWAP